MSWYNDQTLLSFLLEDFSLTDFIEYTEEMNELKQEQQWCLEHPDKTNEEDIKEIQTDIEEYRKNIQELVDDFLTISENHNANIEKEIKRVIDWNTSLNVLLHQNISVRWNKESAGYTNGVPDDGIKETDT